MERLIINGRGDSKLIHPIERVSFPDKQIPVIDQDHFLDVLVRARQVVKEARIGQREATVELRPKHPDLPYYVWLHNDIHLGSILTDYEAYKRDLDIVKGSENFGVVSNGDDIDSFMVTAGKAATGVYENPLSPQHQAFLLQQIFGGLDKQGKLLCTSFGNHTDWLKSSGYDFEDTFLRELSCPVFDCGGLLTLKLGEQNYKMAISHLHWGSSKLNPTNACKRMLEHDFPSADVLYLGHTHMKELLRFTRAGEEHLAVIGGTYKTEDRFGAKHGLGSVRDNGGGITLAFYPDTHKIIPFFSVEEASEDLQNRLIAKRNG